MNDKHSRTAKDEPEEEVTWVPVAEALGATQAAMIVEYLKAEGIQAWVHGGSEAFAFNIGELGKISIMVREEDVEEALSLLQDEEPLSSGSEEDEPDSGRSALSEIALVASAAVVNPVGAALGIAMAYLISDDDESTYETDCPNCDTALELTADEVKQGWFVCPECDEKSEIQAIAICPNCQAELELDQAELTKGYYKCPECQTVTRC